MTDDIRWMDGQAANGKFVLKMVYANGGTAYLKNDSYSGIVHYYNLLQDCPEIVNALILNPDGQPVCEMSKAA
jgi:hypothetical protein